MAVERKTFYGWVIVVLSFSYVFFMGAPLTYSAGVLSPLVAAAHGWGEEVIGTSLSALFGVVAMMSIPGSLVINRIGTRRAVILGASCQLAGMLYLAYGTLTPARYTACFILCGFAPLFSTVLVCPALISAWFERRKALPMSLTLAAGAIGGFFFPVFARRLSSYGVRACWLLFAALQCVCILTALFLLKETAEEQGEVRDGRAWCERHPRMEAAGQRVQLPEPTLKSCYLSKQFYILAVQNFIAKAVAGAMISYAVLFATQKGIAAGTAVLALSIYNLTSFFGRLTAGAADRVKLPLNLSYAFSFALMTAGLLLFALTKTLPLTLTGSVLTGFGFGMLFVLQYLILPAYFGNGNFVSVNGAISTIAYLGNTVGPLLVILIVRLSGGYGYAFALIGILCAVSALLAVCNRTGYVRNKQ